MSLSDGVLTDVTRLGDGETAHVWPFMLPDHDHFLFLAVRADGSDLRVGSLTSPTVVSLGPSQSNATFAAGHLLYVQNGALMAQPFDLTALERRGRAVRLSGSVFLQGQFGAFSSSDNGRLVTIPGERRLQRLTWFSRSGVPTPFGPRAYLWNLALSADERFLAVPIDAFEPPNTDIYVVDLARPDSARRVTTDPRGEYDPAWSPDGSTLIFNSNRSGRYQLMSRMASGEGDDQLLFPDNQGFTSFSGPSFSPDGQSLVFTATGPAGRGLWWSPFPATAEDPKPFLLAPATTSGASFSPDGRWVLYQSNTSGRYEVYIRRFPDAAGLVQVSASGGSAGQWRGDGREVYFLSPDREIMAVELTPKGGTFEPGTPRALFKSDIAVAGGRPFVGTKDGQRFLMAVSEDTAPDPVIALLVNWPQRVPQ